MRKFFIRAIIVVLVIYTGICVYMYVAQESFIFHPEPLAKNEKIDFGLNQEELFIKCHDGVLLNGILCKSKSEKKNGLIFFLHGNAGNLLDQKQAAEFYTNLGFDFFSFDYRGFGKSEGEISDQDQFYKDIKTAYTEMTKLYTEKDITVIGYSIGTAPAAMITKQMNPSKLVLIAPYYSLVDMTYREYPFIPSSLLKYKFETNEFLRKIKTPVLLIHGDKDDVLPFDGSKMLSKLLNNKSRFLAIKNQGHNDFEMNKIFIKNIKSFLLNQLSAQ